ncbi:major facilitator superfamily domain-containing protein [Aspergillus californicus]
MTSGPGATYMPSTDKYAAEKGSVRQLERINTSEATEVPPGVTATSTNAGLSWTLKDILVTLALCALYTGSQIILFFVGGSLTYIAQDIADERISAWLSVSYTVTLAAVSPFCGYLSDLLGRRNVTIMGAGVMMLGCIVLGTAHSFRQCMVGMAFAGAGAAVEELTALAGTSELVPVAKRGFYLALVSGCLLPFTPYVLYSQLLSTHRTWRWGVWICLIWNGVWTLVIILFYFPQPSLSRTETSRSDMMKQTVKKIDVVGGVLSITGVVLLLVALQSGGLDHSWGSVYVLAQLIVGVALIIAFIVWEWKFSKHPIVPKRLFAGQKVVGIMFVISFVVAAFTGSLAALDPQSENLAIGLGALTGFSTGAVLVPYVTVATVACPDDLIATCVALVLTIRAIGGSIGYAIYFNIFTNKFKKNILHYLTWFTVQAGLAPDKVAEFVELFIQAPDQAALLEGVTSQILDAAEQGSRWAYSESLKYVWFASIGFGCCAIIVCIFIGNISHLLTDRVAAKIK